MNGSDEARFIIFSFFVAIIYALMRLIKRIFGRLSGRGKKRKGGKKGKKGKFPEKVFFVKSLTRRRRLDLTRKGDNIMSGKLGKKLDRHRRGMFGK